MPAIPQDAVAPAPARAATARPKLRLLHHMARCGGTLISKCLACMDGVLLLSEIHPRGTRWFNPLIQAQKWFGLFSPEEFASFRRMDRSEFADAIVQIAERARDRHLVLRDWSHLDFTGVPFVAQPAYRLLLADVLKPRFELLHLAQGLAEVGFRGQVEGVCDGVDPLGTQLHLGR